MSVQHIHSFQPIVDWQDLQLEFLSINYRIEELAKLALKKRARIFCADQFVNASDDLEFLIMEKENQINTKFKDLDERAKVLSVLDRMHHKIENLKHGIILEAGTDLEDIAFVINSFFIGMIMGYVEEQLISYIKRKNMPVVQDKEKAIKEANEAFKEAREKLIQQKGSEDVSLEEIAEEANKILQQNQSSYSFVLCKSKKRKIKKQDVINQSQVVNSLEQQVKIAEEEVKEAMKKTGEAWKEVYDHVGIGIGLDGHIGIKVNVSDFPKLAKAKSHESQCVAQRNNLQLQWGQEQIKYNDLCRAFERQGKPGFWTKFGSFCVHIGQGFISAGFGIDF